MQTKEYPLFVLQLFAPGLSAVLSVFCSPVHENVLRWKLCFPCLFPAIWIRRCYNNTDEDYSSILLVFSLLFCSVLLLDSDGKSGFCGNCFRGYCVQCVWVLAYCFFRTYLWIFNTVLCTYYSHWNINCRHYIFLCNNKVYFLCNNEGQFLNVEISIR